MGPMDDNDEDDKPASKAPWAKQTAGDESNASAAETAAQATPAGQSARAQTNGQGTQPLAPWAASGAQAAPPAAPPAAAGGIPAPSWMQQGQPGPGPNWAHLAQAFGGGAGPQQAPMQGPPMGGPGMGMPHMGAQFNPIAQRIAQMMAQRRGAMTQGMPQGGAPMPMQRPPWTGR
jgi:hypothetical protein